MKKIIGKVVASLIGIVLIALTNFFVFKVNTIEYWRYAAGFVLSSFGYAFVFYGGSDTISNEVDKKDAK